MCLPRVERLRHYRTHRQLDAAVDGELADSMRALVARHLVECPECTEEIATRRAMKEALGRYGDDPEAVQGLRRFLDELGGAG